MPVTVLQLFECDHLLTNETQLDLPGDVFTSNNMHYKNQNH